MAVTLSPAIDSVTDVMQSVIDEHFPEIQEHEPAIQVLMATADKAGKPAVKLHGSPALATIKIVGPDERATGGPDLRIKVDSARYAKLTERQREALFAHELFHVVFKIDPDTKDLKRDDYGRPQIKLRPDHWAITGFKPIADIYGDESIEWLSYKNLGKILKQKQGVFQFTEVSPPVVIERSPDESDTEDSDDPPATAGRVGARGGRAEATA